MFRPLTVDDYAAYRDLIHEFRPTVFTYNQFVETLAHIQTSGNVWVYEEDGQLLATATVFYEHKLIMNTCVYAHIEDVCVKGTHRRMGIGRRMIHHLMNVSSHCYKITLDCADSNVAFYLSCGLERRGNQMCQLIKTTE
jgi:glucosamine-phosphate N-acetyltransferase